MILDAETLDAGANFTFDTEHVIFGIPVRVAGLDHLIAMKEAAGRPKDLLMASEYRVISDELRAPRDKG